MMETAFPFSDRAFQLVVLVTFLLLACALTFTLTVAWLHTTNIRVERRWAHLESVWEPMLLAILIGEQEERAIHTQVQRKDVGRFVDFLLRYARELKGAERDTVLRLTEPYLDRIAGYIRHRTPEVRARALQALGELSVEQHNAEFLRALEDSSPLVAMISVQALARDFEPHCAEKLVGVLDRFQDWNPGYLAVVLANMGPESAPILRTGLADTTRPPRVRAVIARALTTLTDIGSADLAGQVLQAEHDTDLVIAVLGLIERVGGPEQLPMVRRLLDSPDQAVRAFAVTTLARLGTHEDTEHIRAALDDESNWVLLHAAQALNEMGQTDFLTAVAGSDHRSATAAEEMLWRGHA